MASEIVRMMLGEARPASLRNAIYRALDNLRRRNPAGYAQMLLMPFGPVPAYAQDDPNSPWWSSEEARVILQTAKDGAREGVKPGGPTRPWHRYEAESPRQAFRAVATPEHHDAQVIAEMGFKSKDEVEIGREVLYRPNALFTPEDDERYRIGGSDWYRVEGFYRRSWFGEPHRVPRDRSDLVGLNGVCGFVAGGVLLWRIPWEAFFRRCVKPELYHHGETRGMPFNRY